MLTVEFMRGRLSLESELKSGYPWKATITEHVATVHKAVMKNNRLIIRHTAETVGNSTGPAHSIFREDLGMRKMLARSVPRMLSTGQKQFNLTLQRNFKGSFKQTQKKTCTGL